MRKPRGTSRPTSAPHKVLATAAQRPDPAGDRAAGTVPAIPAITFLAALAPGAQARVARVTIEDVALARHLADLGLVQGAEVTVEQRGLLGGPLLLRLGPVYYALGEEVARKIVVMRR